MEPMKTLKQIFRKRPHVAVIRLEGTIGMGRRALSDARLATMIERAFKSKPKAIALQINSPGGSPAQSSLIASRIRTLAEEKNIPVIAFVEDVAASGGYWLACAADEIYADRTSILGSIGVISAGFGLQDAIARYGIERRVHTAGESKSFMDPFRPEDPADVERLHDILNDMHEVFIDEIKTRRADRLDDSAPLFTGRVWMGAKAVEVGLADGIAHLGPEMRSRYGDDIRFRKFSTKRSFMSRFGVGLAEDAVHVITERTAFGRFGL